MWFDGYIQFVEKWAGTPMFYTTTDTLCYHHKCSFLASLHSIMQVEKFVQLFPYHANSSRNFEIDIKNDKTKGTNVNLTCRIKNFMIFQLLKGSWIIAFNNSVDFFPQPFDAGSMDICYSTGRPKRLAPWKNFSTIVNKFLVWRFK